MFTHHVTMKMGLEYRMAYDQKIKRFRVRLCDSKFPFKYSCFEVVEPCKIVVNNALLNEYKSEK